MGKRVIHETQHLDVHPHHVTPLTSGVRNIRKRKCASSDKNGKKTLRINAATAAAAADYWRHENDDEDSSSNDAAPPPKQLPSQTVTPRNASHKQANNSSILLNNSFNSSIVSSAGWENNSLLATESPKPVYTLRPSVVNGTVMYDLTQKPWRLGRPIGKGNFGEIFLASDNISIPVTNENAKFVVKIEPHSNGPLFVEIHCLMNTAKKNDVSETIKKEKHNEEESGAKTNLVEGPPSGIPDYIASGSHYFANARYRFLVLPRFDRDLHSLIKKCRVSQKSVLTLAIHIINVLENLHDQEYCHNDVKAQNLMISKCKYLKQSLTLLNNGGTTTTTTTVGRGKQQAATKHIKTAAVMVTSTNRKYKDAHYEEKQQTTDSGNSSEQEANDDDDDDEDFVVKRRSYNKGIDDMDEDYNDDDDDEDEEEELDDEDDDDEDFDDGDTNTTNSNSVDMYTTPLNNRRKNKKANPAEERVKATRNVVPFSGSNPVRSCRRADKSNTIYDEMVSSHYLRPTKRVSYLEFFNEDGVSVKDGGPVGGPAGSNCSSDLHSNSSDDDEFLPLSVRKSIKKSSTTASATKMPSSRRLTKRQEKMLIRNGGGDGGSGKKHNCHDERNDKKKIKSLVTTTVPPHSAAALHHNNHQHHSHHQQDDDDKSKFEQKWQPVEQEHIFLIDYGLASKFSDNGVHRPFIMDQRRAHDGTLEFTSRDAHMGAHSRRSDLECLGYNLLYWSQGYLPWKDAAKNQQQEKVHRAKEYLMTDVRELLPIIYGKQIPKYIGEFLHLVGQLAFHDRPDYNGYRRMFQREFKQLGYTDAQAPLNMHDIQRTCIRVKEELENKNDFFDMNKCGGGCPTIALNIMHNLSASGTPFHERNLANRISPKNLRSKSDKKSSKKKKFSWAEILSQDPDQIARERAEKEFDREEELSDIQQPIVRRFQGRPTYAILEVLNRMGRDLEDYKEQIKREDEENKSKKLQQLKEDCEIIERHDMDVDSEHEPSDEDNDHDDDNENDDDNDDDDNDVDDGDDGNEDANGTDGTDISEEHTEKEKRRTKTSRKSKSSLSTPARKSNTKTHSSTKRSKKSNKKVRVKKSVTAAAAAVPRTPMTPICKRTRRNRILKKPISSADIIILSSERKSKKKSIKKKYSSKRKNTAAAASAAGEIEQQQPIQRERRVRRCLIKTDHQQQTTSDGLEDDSNSNFSTDMKRWSSHAWKVSGSEAMYLRNCKK